MDRANAHEKIRAILAPMYRRQRDSAESTLGVIIDTLGMRDMSDAEKLDNICAEIIAHYSRDVMDLEK